MLNFAAPHVTLFEETEVERVDIPSTAGDMGILANHVPTVQQLRPGVIDVTTADGKSKKLFGMCSFYLNTYLISNSFWRLCHNERG